MSKPCSTFFGGRGIRERKGTRKIIAYRHKTRIKERTDNDSFVIINEDVFIGTNNTEDGEETNSDDEEEDRRLKRKVTVSLRVALCLSILCLNQKWSSRSS